MEVDFGVIGGSGFYKLLVLEKPQKHLVTTPFGDVELTIGEISGARVAFLPRHGEKHSIPPHLINYKANAYAMYIVGAEKVIATSAVGSLRRYILPGDLVVPDQIIDFTKNREYTFFNGKFSIKLRDGNERKGVFHVDVTEPYCEELRQAIISVAESRGLRVHPKGTYVCTEGPRFETPAEIRFFQMIGGDIVGMTNSPEVFLFKELGICYALISVVTNFAAGMQARVSHEEVLELFNKKAGELAELIREIIINLIK